MRGGGLHVRLRRLAATALGLGGALVAAGAAAVNVPILELDAGLTFARIPRGEALHVLAVVADDGERIRAVDLTARLGTDVDGPFELLRAHGHAELRRAVASGVESGRVGTFERAALATPVDVLEHAVATAVNYPDHAREVGAAPRQPVLFPKLATASGPDARLAAPARALLDYEVELGAVVGARLDDAADLDRVPVGFVLVNDLTDRARLVGAAWPTRGLGRRTLSALAASKSGERMLQLGPYLVVPRAPDAFVARIELRLTVDGELRQRDVPASMTVGPDDLMARALRSASTRFRLGGRTTTLLPGEAFRPGQLLLTGTPGGTAYRGGPPPPPGGERLGEQARARVLERWREREAASNRYLRLGSIVRAAGTYLGTMRLEITR